MFPSQMVHLKIVEPSSADFVHVYLANGTSLKLSIPQVAHFVHVSIANGMP